LLPLSIDALVHKNSGNNNEMLRFLNDYTVAFEADIINLLTDNLRILSFHNLRVSTIT